MESRSSTHTRSTSASTATRQRSWPPRGGTSLDEGGYLWRGEVRLWDNEIVMGWYLATEGAVRSKGVMYFVVHPHGIHLAGRWVGLSHDGPIVTGWGAVARTESQALAVVNHLREKGVPPP